MSRQIVAVPRGGPRRNGAQIPLEQMCDLPHVLFSPDGRTSDDTDTLLKAMGRARRIVATVPTFSGVFSVLRKTDIIGTLPTHLTDIFARLDNITRHPVPVDRPEIDLAMLWHRRNDNAPLHRWLRDQIIECLGEDLATV